MQEKRREVIELERGNRQLRHELEGYDRKIVLLEQRLDSLQVQEARMKLQIRALDSATAATRSERLALEARLNAMESRLAKRAKGGGSGR
jgi:phage shock protein A